MKPEVFITFVKFHTAVAFAWSFTDMNIYFMQLHFHTL